MEIDQQKQQELIMKFQMFEQQINAINQQLEAIEGAIVEMSSLNLGLDELIGKKDNEIMAPIGRGIYVKAKLVSEELLVDIGNKNLIKKSIPQTQELIQEQIKKLETIREELNGELEKINQELTNTFMTSQDGLQGEPHSHEHKHSPNCKCTKEECDCGEDCECSHEYCECEDEVEED
jgi:prefoldin alpha subunit